MPKRAPEHSPQTLTTLFQLVRLGAGTSFVSLSTPRLGAVLGLTQQGASSRLGALEKEGLIERVRSGRGLAVRLTSAGLRTFRSFYGPVGGLATEDGELRFKGSLFTGLGEGAYYVSLGGYAGPFKGLLGFVPFPGTLNLRLRSPEMVSQRRLLGIREGIEVPGFKDGGRTFGPVKVFRAAVGKHPAAVLAIERTHYDDSVLEVISPLNLRKSLKLKDGDECDVTVSLDSGPTPRP